MSTPQSIPTENGGARFLLSAQNRDYTAPALELPPARKSHGGPVVLCLVSNLGIQYWTSRGFAVLDVNYGGSTDGNIVSGWITSGALLMMLTV